MPVITAPSHYPGGSPPDPSTLRDVLVDVALHLGRTDLRWLVMGGIGSAAHARPRRTDDIDLLVHAEDCDDALDVLADNGFEVERTDPRWLYKAFRDGVLVDLVFRSSGDVYLDDQMLQRGIRCSYHGIELPMVSAEDLLVIKALATGEYTAHHWYDALAIVSLSEIDWAYLIQRARSYGPRRVLSLLLFAESLDLTVPTRAVEELFRTLHPPEQHQTEQDRRDHHPQPGGDDDAH